MSTALIQLAKKEFLQLFRDPRTRFGLLVPTILQVLLYGYAVSLEVRDVPMAVLDLDHSYESRDLLGRFVGSRHFWVVRYLTDPAEIEAVMARGDAFLTLYVLPGFSAAVRGGRPAHVEAIFDGVDSNTAMIVTDYVREIATSFALDYERAGQREARLATTDYGPRIELRPRPWYNTNFKSSWFFVPGTIGSILLTSCSTLAAFAIVREKEIGTLDQIVVSPISQREFLLGKTIPFFLLGMTQAVIIGFAGEWWFQIPFQGSYMLVLISTTLFLCGILGVAVLISTFAATQQQVMVVAFFWIVPAVSLSGFGFAINCMPIWMQWLTYFDPLRYYLVIVRYSFLKGHGWATLWSQICALAIIGGIVISIAVLRFERAYFYDRQKEA